MSKIALQLNDFSWERMIRAVEDVRDRLLRASAALEAAGIPYAVIGGNAVAAWVSRVDVAAVRNTQDVDLLVNRTDLDAIKKALADNGFVYRHLAGIDMFIDKLGGKARNAVHLIFAGEKVRAEDAVPTPDVTESERGKDYCVVNLEALVRMKLTSYRIKDRMHLLDLIDVGLIDESWRPRLPAELADRLQTLIDNPNA